VNAAAYQPTDLHLRKAVAYLRARGIVCDAQTEPMLRAQILHGVALLLARAETTNLLPAQGDRHAA
jgi:hypothetical protein